MRLESHHRRNSPCFLVQCYILLRSNYDPIVAHMCICTCGLEVEMKSEDEDLVALRPYMERLCKQRTHSNFPHICSGYADRLFPVV